MPAFDLENDDDFRITEFDTNRLNDAEVGDSINLEFGGKVLVYKDSYILFLENDQHIRRKNVLSKEFKTLNQLLSFLSK